MDTEFPSPVCDSPRTAPPAETAFLRPLDRPSFWLRSGFVRCGHIQERNWLYRRGFQPIDPGSQPLTASQLDSLFSDEPVRSLLACLADSFARFLPITAAQWEADFRQSPCPETLLRLWESVLGVYCYYTTDKKLPPGATADYYWLILDFCNTGAGDFLQDWYVRCLTPGRVTRVIDELRRWFRQGKASADWKPSGVRSTS